MKLYIPKILLYSRLLFAIVIAAISFSQPENSKFLVLLLMYIGIVADIFDGILARKLNISTDNFRLLDTIFDLVFYISIILYISNINSNQLRENTELILVVLILESLLYLTSLIKFKKLPSPHAILSKFWGLYLVVEFTLLIIGVPGIHFTIALIIGTIVHIDRLLIYILLRQWDHDIPSSYHALLLRQGKSIKRSEIFNG